MGLGLVQAQTWLSTRGEDLARSDREFIDLSLKCPSRLHPYSTSLRLEGSPSDIADLDLFGGSTLPFTKATHTAPVGLEGRPSLWGEKIEEVPHATP
jgi:hypothetical protein